MTTRGYSLDKDSYQRRLRRIEGQVRGVARMIDEDVYCIDVLTQIAAITKALHSVSLGLVDQHVRHCVANTAAHDPQHGQEMVTEALAAIERLMKS